MVIRVKAITLRWAVARVKKGAHQATKLRKRGREQEDLAAVYRSLSAGIGSAGSLIAF
jgi:hypothetical protein